MHESEELDTRIQDFTEQSGFKVLLGRDIQQEFVHWMDRHYGQDKRKVPFLIIYREGEDTSDGLIQELLGPLSHMRVLGVFQPMQVWLTKLLCHEDIEGAILFMTEGLQTPQRLEAQASEIAEVIVSKYLEGLRWPDLLIEIRKG